MFCSSIIKKVDPFLQNSSLLFNERVFEAYELSQLPLSCWLQKMKKKIGDYQ